MKYKYFIVV